MEDLTYREIFRQRWLAILVALVVGAGFSTLVAFSVPPTYSSTATLFLVVDDPTATLVERSQFSLARVNSYTGLVASSEVLQPVITDLNLDLTVQDLSNTVSASNPNDTVNIAITAQARSASDASAIANAVADSLSRLVAKVENFGTLSVSLEPLIPALTPVAPSAPPKAVIIGLGVLSGLAGGAIIALLLARFDRRIHSIAAVRRTTGLPVLGAIPRRPRQAAREHERDELDSAVTEAVARIAQANGGGMPRLLLLVSAGHQSGIAHVRLAMADAVAATGRQALLVESQPTEDPSSPLSGFVSHQGLADLVTGTAILPDVIRPSAGLGSLIVGAGIATPTDAETESSFRGVVTRLLASADVVITQVAPAASPVSIALVAPYADVSVILVHYNQSSEWELTQAVSELRIAGVRPIGVVLVDAPRWHRLDLMATWVPDDFVAKPGKALVTLRRTAAARRPPEV